MDVLTKEQRRKNMQAIKSTGSKEEVILARTLWRRGYRYRKNDKTVYGKPDITFRHHRIAIFVDSEFFHGKDWKTGKFKIKSNQEFWWRKIERNISRDKEVTEKLTAEGWVVLRFWSLDVKRNIGECICEIEETIRKRNDKIL